jgi:hypothetical protein
MYAVIGVILSPFSVLLCCPCVYKPETLFNCSSPWFVTCHSKINSSSVYGYGPLVIFEPRFSWLQSFLPAFCTRCLAIKSVILCRFGFQLLPKKGKGEAQVMVFSFSCLLFWFGSLWWKIWKPKKQKCLCFPVLMGYFPSQTQLQPLQNAMIFMPFFSWILQRLRNLMF